MQKTEALLQKKSAEQPRGPPPNRNENPLEKVEKLKTGPRGCSGFWAKNGPRGCFSQKTATACRASTPWLFFAKNSHDIRGLHPVAVFWAKIVKKWTPWLFLGSKIAL
jgi:hypothetical protein